ncbi:MAG: hypothetical protein ACOC2J_05005 [bacterium]
MNKFKSLILIQFKNFLGKAQSGLNIKNKKLGRLLQLLLLVAIATPAVNFSVFTFKAFSELNQPELLITSTYISSVMLMFFLGTPIIVSVFFYAKDMRFLSTLPIREDTLIFSKLGTVYMYLLAVSLIIMGSGLVVYGINTGINFQLIFSGLLALILSPLLPLLISALLVLSMSRIISKSKYRNVLTIAGNLLLIIILIGFQMGMTRFATDPDYAQKIFSEQGLLGLVGLRFPPSIWLTNMITGSVIDAIYFLGLNLIFIVVLQFLARLFFKKSLQAYSQGAAGSGRIYYVQRSQGWQLFKRHMMIIFKQPTFLLNAVLSLIVPVIMFIVMSFSGQFSLEMLTSEEIKQYLVLIFSGILISPAIVSNISSTAITREGQAFWETKVLPISAEANIKYRILTTIVINILGILILSILSAYLLPVTLKMILLGIFLAVTTTFFLGTLDFIVNIYRPLLNWSHPTAAIKNNMNVTISLGIRAVIGLIFFGIYKLFPSLLSNYNLVILFTGIIFLGGYIITHYLLYNNFVSKFNRISL